ncbi:hypothetical protein C5167_044989, partial [Papaver somniferum]
IQLWLKSDKQQCLIYQRFKLVTCFVFQRNWDYFLYEEYIVFWPQLVYVAEDPGNGCIVGFIFAQVDGEGGKSHGYIANLGVLHTHRKLGIATKLMDASQNALVQEYGSEYVSLHVRTSNQATINLYTEKLGYSYGIAANFYGNGEDAYRSCDLVCFPGEDPVVCSSYFEDSILSTLEVAYVAEYGGRIVGYVVSTILEKEPEEEESKGIAAKLMTAAQNALVQEYGCECVYLNVRPSNYAAINLYTKILGYKFHDTTAKFYDDGEDAYVMRKQLQGKQPNHLVLGFSHGGGCFWS